MPIAPADRDWLSFLRLARPRVDWDSVGPVLCLDPGETTGWAVFASGELIEWGQEPTGRDPAATASFVRSWRNTVGRIIYETYRVRGNKFNEHVGSEVVTIQHIGAIKVVAAELDLPIEGQTAGQAKGFATDPKLRRWGLYQPNMRHANDAIRHGCYWHLFVAGRSQSE